LALPQSHPAFITSSLVAILLLTRLGPAGAQLEGPPLCYTAKVSRVMPRLIDDLDRVRQRPAPGIERKPAGGEHPAALDLVVAMGMTFAKPL